MQLGHFTNLVMNKANGQYSLTIKARALNKMRVQPQDILRAKINFLDLKRR